MKEETFKYEGEPSDGDKQSTRKRSSSRPKRNRGPFHESKFKANFRKQEEKVDLILMREKIIAKGFGMSVPAFRSYSATDEETYIPVGIVNGFYVPVGVDASSEIYPQFGTLFCQRVLTRLRNLGYANDYTVDQLRGYFNGVALGLQMQRFIRDLRTINEFQQIHTSGPCTALTRQAINGKLIAQHRMLTKLLSALPFPVEWQNAYLEGFGATTLSDNPFGPIRLFCPKNFQPETGEPYLASNLTDALISAMDTLYAVPETTELASILGNIMKPSSELDMVGSTPIHFNQAAVNNILNLPYFDGTTNDPSASDTETVKYFYRRQIVPYGMLTYAPDNNILTTIQGTVWVQRTSGVSQSPTSRIAIDNDGSAIAVAADATLWTNFGSIWEASLSLEGSPGPSVAYVNTTFTSVSTGVADLILNAVAISK
jgi:hypothetical protein